MKPKEKAEEIFKSFLPFTCNYEGIYDINNLNQTHKANAQAVSLKCVEKIISALKITIGHLELRRLD